MTIKIINWGKNGKGYLLNNIYKKFKYTINGDTITINYNKIKFIINNYHAYNLNESIIQTLLNQKRFGYREFLDQNKKFNEYINNQKYKDGFFMKVIKKFFQSKLAITSIERLFSIEKKEYEQLFKVLSEDIEKLYIYNALLLHLQYRKNCQKSNESYNRSFKRKILFRYKAYW